MDTLDPTPTPAIARKVDAPNPRLVGYVLTEIRRIEALWDIDPADWPATTGDDENP